MWSSCSTRNIKGGAVSSDGRFGARVEENTIEVLDIATGQDKFSFPGHDFYMMNSLLACADVTPCFIGAPDRS